MVRICGKSFSRLPISWGDRDPFSWAIENLGLKITVVEFRYIVADAHLSSDHQGSIFCEIMAKVAPLPELIISVGVNKSKKGKGERKKPVTNSQKDLRAAVYGFFPSYVMYFFKKGNFLTKWGARLKTHPLTWRYLW